MTQENTLSAFILDLYANPQFSSDSQKCSKPKKYYRPLSKYYFLFGYARKA
jgi:hypothetical protein